MCLFVLLFVSVMLTNMFDSETLQWSAHRNVVDYERALYLANAAVHHAAAELEANVGWRGIVVDGAFPASDTYQATAIDGTGNTVLITGVGVSGDVRRTVRATLVQMND